MLIIFSETDKVTRSTFQLSRTKNAYHVFLFGCSLYILRSNNIATLYTCTSTCKKSKKNLSDICIQICCFYILLQDFPEKAWEPKVQLPYKAEQGQVPRKIEIERFVLFAVYWKS